MVPCRRSARTLRGPEGHGEEQEEDGHGGAEVVGRLDGPAADLALGQAHGQPAGGRPLPQPAGLGRGRGLAGGVEGGGHGQAGGGQLGGVGLGQGAGHLAGDRVVARLDHGHRGRPALLDRRRQAGREQEGGVDLAPVDQGPGLARVDLAHGDQVAQARVGQHAVGEAGRHRPPVGVGHRVGGPEGGVAAEGQPDDGGQQERGDEGDHQGRPVAQPLAQVLAGDQQGGPQHGVSPSRPCR
jgi:hypothetical protein